MAFLQIGYLHVDRSSIGDAALDPNPRLPRLLSLNLTSTTVGDEGLKGVADLKKMSNPGSLQARTLVTQAFRDWVDRANSACYLDLRGTRVSRDMAARLKTMLPRCTVNYPEAAGRPWRANFSTRSPSRFEETG